VSGQEEGEGEQRQGAEGKSSPHLNDVSASPSPAPAAASSPSSDSDLPLHGHSNSHGDIGDAITPISGGASSGSSSELTDSAGPRFSCGSSDSGSDIESESESGFCGNSALESSLSAAVAEAERRERAVDLVPTSPRFSRAVTIQMVRDIQSDASSAFAAAAQPMSPAVACNEGGIEVLMHRHSNKALMTSMITGQVAPLITSFGARSEAQALSLPVGAIPSLIGSLSGRGALSTDSLDDAGEQDSDLNDGEEGETNTGTGSGSGGGCEEHSKFLPLPSLPLPLLLPSLLDCMEDISYLETLALDALREAASYNHSHQAHDSISSSSLYAGQHQQQYSGGYFV
jgi:hypothetical protein